MFKQILIILLLLLIIIVNYFIIKRILIITHKLNISNDICKYNLNDIDRQFLDRYSENYDISHLINLDKNLIFYTSYKWSVINNNNYILSNKDNKYYIIDKDYFYHINSIDNFKIYIESGDVKIKLFNFDRYHKKINYI
jgi:hypothetical protein